MIGKSKEICKLFSVVFSRLSSKNWAILMIPSPLYSRLQIRLWFCSSRFLLVVALQCMRKHDVASVIGPGKGFRLRKSSRRWTTNISYSRWQICVKLLLHSQTYWQCQDFSLGVLEMELQWNLLSTWWWEVWWPLFLKVASRWESGIESSCYCQGNITGS